VEVNAQLFRGVVAARGIFLETFENDAFEFRGDALVAYPGRDGRLVEDGVDEASGQGVVKRALAGGHFVENGAERVDIGARVGLLAFQLFGGHIRERAGSGRSSGEAGGELAGGGSAKQPGEAEIEHFGLVFGGDHNVGRLEVAMNHPVLVRFFKGLSDLRSERSNFFF